MKMTALLGLPTLGEVTQMEMILITKLSNAGIFVVRDR